MDWVLEVEGAEEVEQFLAHLEPRLLENLFIGFKEYAKRYLVPRIKARLAQAAQPHQPSKMGLDGQPSAGGGYGVPSNSTKYAEWKASRSNLPLVGTLSSRELVATGFLVESIDILKLEKLMDGFTIEVGHKPGMRPTATPHSNNPPGSNQADVSKVVENTQLAEWIEDSKYAFWVTEYEDVMRNIEPLVLSILKKTIHQLWSEYVKKVA